jgi:hypothetical protein
LPHVYCIKNIGNCQRFLACHLSLSISLFPGPLFEGEGRGRGQSKFSFPTLANLLERDLTKHGVSIVNVGGVGLRRYARIFQRKNDKENEKEKEKDSQLTIPVACLTDMDVMPNCAPTIIGKLKEKDEWPDVSKRRWRARKDFANKSKLDSHRKEKESIASGQYVKTFVSDEWTLEYDLAICPKDEKGKYSASLAEDLRGQARFPQQVSQVMVSNAMGLQIPGKVFFF